VPLPASLSSRQGLWRLVRFTVTGATGFLLDFGSLILFRSGLRVPLAVATVASYATGCTVHYLLTRYWVFPHDHAGEEMGKVFRYVLVAGLNVVLTLLIVMAGAGLGLDYRVAKLIAVVTLFCTNYVVMPRFVMAGLGSARA
jgi:putative flippase GtrA